MAAPAHPRETKSEGLRTGAGCTTLRLAAALRGGRALSLASLVAIGCSLTSCVIRIYNKITGHPSIGHKSRVVLKILLNYKKKCPLRSSLRQAQTVCDLPRLSNSKRCDERLRILVQNSQIESDPAVGNNANDRHDFIVFLFHM